MATAITLVVKFSGESKVQLWHYQFQTQPPEKLSHIETKTIKVSLLGVDSLWGDCTFIPADLDFGVIVVD